MRCAACARAGGSAPTRSPPSGTAATTWGCWRSPGIAVAPANAHPEVLAAADLITASNDEDGVAQALARIVP